MAEHEMMDFEREEVAFIVGTKLLLILVCIAQGCPEIGVFVLVLGAAAMGSQGVPRGKRVNIGSIGSLEGWNEEFPISAPRRHMHMTLLNRRIAGQPRALFNFIALLGTPARIPSISLEPRAGFETQLRILTAGVFVLTWLGKASGDTAIFLMGSLIGYIFAFLQKYLASTS